MGEFIAETPEQPHDPNWRWRHEMTRYHWFVLIVAALGWIFDCLDQQLFTLARKPAMEELLRDANGVVDQAQANAWAPITTAVFLVGWATGGILFGILGDRIGRVKTMVWTILAYSACTGLSAISKSVYDFAFYRFLTGMGVGGEFAVGVALVAETMPDRARPFALGLLQALSTVGNITAGLVSMGLGKVGTIHVGELSLSPWRVMFLIGTLPALLAVVVQMRLKEPERWKSAVGTDPTHKHKAGSLGELFGDPRWRQRAVVGMILASAGVIGLWAIGFFSYDLNRSVFKKYFENEYRASQFAEKDQDFLRAVLAEPAKLGEIKDKIPSDYLISPTAEHKDAQVVYEAMLEVKKADQPVTTSAILAALDQGTLKRKPQTAEDRSRREAYLSGTPVTSVADHQQRIETRNKELNEKLALWTGLSSLMLNCGAFFGVYAFSHFTHRYGRRRSFAIALVLAMVSTALVVTFISRPTDVFWMTPAMGFCQLSLFGGYAIYFPELFPTRLRSTGTSFCYNVGRYVAAGGTLMLGVLTSSVFADTSEPIRWASLSMCAIFLLGLLVLPFAPETKGKPLPE